MQSMRLESNINQNVVEEEIQLLTDMLLEATKKITSTVTFNKIVELKKLADRKEYDELNEIIKTLNQEEMEIIANFFSTLPLLINISEDVDLAFEVNYKNNSEESYVGKLSDSIKNLKDTNILNNINVVPVLTAHPTQVQRKTTLDLTENIHNLLRKHRDVKNGLINKSKWLFLGAFIDLYIFAAAKYAVNYRLGEELNGYFSIIFIPTSIINLMAGFIIRPILTKLSLLYKTGNRKKFISTISKIAVFIFVATLFGMLAAYILGIPALKLVLGDVGNAIEPYKPALVLVILGGGLYAIVNLGYYCLVIFEMTGVIFSIYAIGAVFAYFISDFMVKSFGMNGAAFAYMITMLLLSISFLVAVIFGLRKVKK